MESNRTRACIAFGGFIVGAMGCVDSVPVELDASPNGQQDASSTQDSHMPLRDVSIPPLPSPTEYHMERVSVSGEGAPGNAGSSHPIISSDGRFVVFMSYASNLVDGDTEGTADIFIRDRALRTTERVDSCGNDGVPRGISRDGRFVVYLNTDRGQLLVRDRVRGSTIRAGGRDTRGAGICGHGDDWRMAVSGGSNTVVLTNGMHSMGTGLNRVLAGGTDPFTACDAMGRMEVAFQTSQGIYATGERYDANTDTQIDISGSLPLLGLSALGSISEDGAFVVYQNRESSSGYARIFLGLRSCASSCVQHVLTTPSLEASDNGFVNESSSEPIVQSVQGSHGLNAVVAYTSRASNLIPRDANEASDVFVTRSVDLGGVRANTTHRVSVGEGGRETPHGHGSYHPSLSGDGRWVAFDSVRNLVSGSSDANLSSDVFVAGVDYFFRVN